MPVFTTPRRITLYWLLLLVPALVVGAGAIFLLRREQGRLVERGAYADEARRAAAAARTRLIVENVELLVGDVQMGLLDTLAAEPAEGLDAFLERWQNENPLVRSAFRATSAGRVMWPEARTAGEDGRGFLRRFTQQFGAHAPWVVELPPDEQAFKKRQLDDALVRKEVGANVAQVQSARRDVQELLKTPSYSNAAGANMAGQGVAEYKAEADEAARERSASAVSRAQKPASMPMSPPAFTAAPRLKDAAAAERRGWSPWTVDGRLHLVGWVQPGGAGDVRGVELELSTVIGKFAGALPADVSAVEGYALRDGQGRVMHQIGAVPQEGQPTFRVPLSTATLPGWDAVVYLSSPVGSLDMGVGFFWPTTLLVAIFVTAILGGGYLLVAQARRSEAEAAQKTSFVANVSHEFKTPLTTIRLYAELLEQGRVRDAAQGGDYLRTIGRETQRLARLVNNALDFSRLEQGKKKYAREAVDLGAALTRLLDTHGPRVAEAGMELKRDLPSEPLRVTTDRDALEQIVLNLIDNACKYATDGGEVVVAVAARNAGAGAVVRVMDRGPGVPVEHRERIFEKFHRVDDALTAEKTGAGLGLSIARQLARGLGGELRYAPREGGGAEFILELP